MASLSVRNLDHDTYESLRQRAARHGVSMEEEARRILRRAVKAPERLGDLFLARFGPDNAVDLEPLPRAPHRPMAFDE